MTVAQPGLFDAAAAAAPERMARGAVLSACGRYRYALTRVWNHALPRCLFVMLNPSTADATADDPTIRKCVGFSKRLGAGSLEVVNLYALRSTDPRVLRAFGGMAHGPENETHVREAVARAATIVCGWGGGLPKGSTRPVWLRAILGATGRGAVCFGRTGAGEPRHPLMLAYETAHETYHTGSGT